MTALILCTCLWSLLAATTVKAQVNVPANWSAPLRMLPPNTPQFIVVTTDDHCTSREAKPLVDMLRGVKNPNGCTVPMTWFCTSGLSDCTTQKRLYDLGHEIGTHTKTHPNLTSLTTTAARKEIVGARNYTIACGIPSKHAVGFRAPYLEASKTIRAILKNNSFLYDASIPVMWNSPESPSKTGTKQLWPYSLYQGVKQIYSCKWFGDDLMDPIPVQSILKQEFNRNYNAYRTPIGVWGHYNNYFIDPAVRAEVTSFLSWALGYNGVYVVTMRQLVDWVQNPHPVSNMTNFLKRYPCPTTAAF